MSGPYCESCIHFYPAMMGDRHMGECTDPLKSIKAPGGGDWNHALPVHRRCSCFNHETNPDKRGEK